VVHTYTPQRNVHAPDLGSVLQAAPHVTERRLLNKKEEEEEEEVHEITATDKKFRSRSSHKIVHFFRVQAA
jgi:hypothetical protein